MKLMHLFYKFCLLFFWIFSLANCQTSPDPQHIRIALNSNPPTLDWNLATDNVSYQVLTQLMEGLTQFDLQAKTLPAIAKSWESRDGGRTYIFHLDTKYRWSDGRPVIAQHFVDSWVRLLKPATASEYAYYLFDIVNARDFNAGRVSDSSLLGVRAIDDQTLEVRLTKPIAFFPSLVSFMVTYPIRLDLIEKYGDHWTDADKLITCGPFQLSDAWPEYRFTLKQNPHYGGAPKPTLTQVDFFVVNEPTTALTLADAGLLDVAPLPALALEQFKNDAHLVRQTKLRGYYYGFHVRQIPFDDPYLRKALAMSLNKAELPSILKGGETPIDSWIPPPLIGYWAQAGLKFDPVQAKQWLAKTKWNPQEPLTLFFNSDALNKKIAEWAQDQWMRHLGLKVILKNMEWKAYLNKMHNEPPGFFRMGWGADYPDADNFMNLFTSSSGNNYTGFHSATYDALIAEAASESNTKQREQLYFRAQKILLEEETVIIPLFIASQYLWVRPDLQPYPSTPMDFAYLKRIYAPNP